MTLAKSRDISIQDLYTLLQLEYISYKVREKIYKRPEDKKKFSDICQMKKEKIVGLAMKNCLPTIFKDDSAKQKYFDKFLNDFGLPNFQYRNEYKQSTQGKWDKVYWFAPGVSVRVNIDGEIKLGEIISLDRDVNRVSLKGECGNVSIEINKVSRLLTDEFFKLD